MSGSSEERSEPDAVTPTAQPAPAACLHDVVVRYGDRVALSVTRLELRHGERIAVLGPSGAGKSTLLRVLVGAQRPDSGQVRILGRDISDPDSLDRGFRARVGYLSQSLDLVTQLSAAVNVGLGRVGRQSGYATLRSVIGSPSSDVAAVIRDVGLDGKERQRTSRLSGGEQQRVAIGRLLYQQPEVVVADEPVANLDPARADDLLDRLAASVQGGTVVISLHDPERAQRWCDRIIGLRDGQVALDKRAADVEGVELESLYRLRQ